MLKVVRSRSERTGSISIFIATKNPASLTQRTFLVFLCFFFLFLSGRINKEEKKEMKRNEKKIKEKKRKEKTKEVERRRKGLVFLSASFMRQCFRTPACKKSFSESGTVPTRNLQFFLHAIITYTLEINLLLL
jgi:Na+-transporting methylmalonyl-CoA/oxaloacetate decarboxylase gamma subunit